MRTAQYLGVLSGAISIAFLVAGLTARLWTDLLPTLPF
jgi:hypothetical protein